MGFGGGVQDPSGPSGPETEGSSLLLSSSFLILHLVVRLRALLISFFPSPLFSASLTWKQKKEKKKQRRKTKKQTKEEKEI